jgi:putative FmdB family regulatory protein
MPTYVYTCDSCGAQFEKFQSFKEEPLRTCTQCGNDAARRVFQPVGIVFKGSGWYITDSRNSSQSTVSGTSETSKSDSSDTTTSKSDTTTSKSDTSATTTHSDTSTSGASSPSQSSD